MRIIYPLIALFMLSLTPAMAQEQNRVQVGRLNCTVEGGVGLIIGSSKDATCTLTRENGTTETYTGNIKKLGLDIGITGETRIVWLVFNAGDAAYAPGALSGTYVGASGEASLGVGVGANWLVGGSRDSFMLQPFSVQGQTGVNLAVGLTGLTLN